MVFRVAWGLIIRYRTFINDDIHEQLDLCHNEVTVGMEVSFIYGVYKLRPRYHSK